MAERENPPQGYEWPNNGEVYERARMECLDLAAKAEAEGDAEGAAVWRERAETDRRLRNRDYNEHQRRVAGRRARHGAW